MAAILAAAEVNAGYLIVHAATPSWADEVRTKLVATGLLSGPIDIFNASIGTPTLATLQSYDGVHVWSDGGFNNSTALGNALADYVDAGGGVVVQVFANASVPIGGRWAAQNYDPIEPLNQTQFTPLTLGTVYDASHPIMANVDNFSGGSSSYRSTGILNPSAERIADWSNGSPLVATLETLPGRIASLNFYPPSSDSRSDFWTSSTDGAILMANALNYVSAVAEPPVVPEPASMALLCMGGGVLAFGRKRLSRQQSVSMTA